MIYSAMQYYRSKLTRTEKLCYDRLLSELYRYNYSITLDHVLTQESADKVLTAISYDNPLLFFIDVHQVKIVYTLLQMRMLFTDVVKKDTARKFLPYCIAVTRKNVARLTEGRHSDSEKYEAIHDYVTANTEYCKNDNKLMDPFSIIGPLVNKKGVCEGFSRYFKLLCDQAHLKCIVVTGEAGLENDKSPHMWNMVCIDNTYRHIDTTFDRGMIYMFSRRKFFMLRDSQIAYTHSWDRSQVPACY